MPAIITTWNKETIEALGWCVHTWDYIVDLARPCRIYRTRKIQVGSNQLGEMDKFPRAINHGTSSMRREGTTTYPSHAGFNCLCQCPVEQDGIIYSSSGPSALESCEDQADSIQTSGSSSSYCQEAVGGPFPPPPRASSLGTQSKERKERRYPDRDFNLELNLS